MDRAELIQRIRNSRPEDYDGHTEFPNMSANQRLRWLSGVAQFLYEAREAVVSPNFKRSVTSVETTGSNKRPG